MQKPVSGPHALAEALDAAKQKCLHAGRPGLDVVCGDINMARPPLSSLKKNMSLSRCGRSNGFLSRRSSALIRVAPLLLRGLARCAVLPSLLLLVPRCPGWSRSDPKLWNDATYDVLEIRGILPVSDWTKKTLSNCTRLLQLYTTLSHIQKTTIRLHKSTHVYNCVEKCAELITT